MERRMIGNYHVRCEAGEKLEITSKAYLSLFPSDLATYGSEAKKLLQDLQSRNERMFLLTFLVLNTADNPRQLGNNIFQAGSIAQKYNCQLTRLDFQQESNPWVAPA